MSAEPILDEAIIRELEELDAGGGGGFLAQIIGVFEEQAVDLLQQLEAAVNHELMPEICALSHKLKGSARTVGGARLGIHCERLEHAARSREVIDGPSQMSRIRDAYGELVQVLHARLARG